jgi:sirohydrochlorin ferrochelatase
MARSRMPFVQVAAVLLVVLGASTAAHGGPAHATRVGVLVLAHGGHGSNRWDGIVRKAVRKIRLGQPMEVAFGMGMHATEVRRFQESVDRLERKGVERLVVVPLLVSSHSEVYRQYQYLFGLRDTAEWPEAGKPLRLEVPVAMGQALDDHHLVAEVLLERARELSRQPSEEQVILLAHGPTSDEDEQIWLQHLDQLAEFVHQQGGFAQVDTFTFRDDAPKTVRDEAVRELRSAVQEGSRHGRVLVVPVLIAQGGVEHKIPQMLTGLSYAFSGQALLPHENVEAWIAEQARLMIGQGATATPSADAADDDTSGYATSGVAKSRVLE